MGGQRHAPGALPPGKTRYPLYRRLDGPQGQSGKVRKISPPTCIWSPERPAHSESVQQLRYPAHLAVTDSDGNDGDDDCYGCHSDRE